MASWWNWRVGDSSFSQKIAADGLGEDPHTETIVPVSIYKGWLGDKMSRDCHPTV